MKVYYFFSIFFLFLSLEAMASKNCADHLRSRLHLEILEPRENPSAFGVDYFLSAHLTNESTSLPAEQVTVRVLDPQGHLVASGKTDTQGVWQTTINRLQDHPAFTYYLPFTERVLNLTTFEWEYLVLTSSVTKPAQITSYFNFEISGGVYHPQTIRVNSHSENSTQYMVPLSASLEVQISSFPSLPVSISSPVAGSFLGVKAPFAVGTEGSYYANQPQVIGFSEEGHEKLKLIAYPNWYGAVHVALVDVNRDGVPDVITVPGKGGGPIVKVFDGVNGNLISSFFAFESDLRTGLNIAARNNPKDGSPIILLGADVGGGPAIKKVDPWGKNLSSPFFAFSSDFRGGVRVALGDVNGDGVLDIIATPALGMAPEVRVFDGSLKQAFLLSQFMAFSDSGYRWGVNLATFDRNKDGKDEIVVGASIGGSPRITVFSGDGVLYSSFFAFNSRDRGGVQVGTLAGNIIATSNLEEKPGYRIFSSEGELKGARFIKTGLQNDSAFRKGWSVFGFSGAP